MDFLIASLVILFIVCFIATPIFFAIGIFDLFRKTEKQNKDLNAEG